MIAEPRVRRLIYFGIYTFLGAASTGVLFRPPNSIVNLLGGIFLVWGFAGAIILGSILGMISVLPGVWWLERAGLIAIVTGIVMYTASVIILGAQPLSMALPIVVVLICALRWLDIKEYLLAPREG